jgi:hypothetical protein
VGTLPACLLSRSGTLRSLRLSVPSAHPTFVARPSGSAPSLSFPQKTAKTFNINSFRHRLTVVSLETIIVTDSALHASNSLRIEKRRPEDGKDYWH